MKETGKSSLRASIHLRLMNEIKAPYRGQFRIFRSKLTEVNVLIMSYLYSHVRLS